MKARYRLESVAVRGLAAIVAALSHLFSLGALVEAAASIGRSYAKLSGPRVDVARINLAIAFPESSEGERKAVLVESFANSARSIAELLLLQGRHRDELLEGVRLEGADELRLALANSPSGGVIALTAHFGSWELCGAVSRHSKLPLCVVHRAFDNPLLGEIVKDWRVNAGLEVVALGAAGLGVLRALRRGKIVAMLLDQDAKPSEGVFAPFFSRLASTRSGPAMLAMTTQTPVLPVFIFREPAAGGSPRHVVRVFPALPLEFGGGETEAEHAPGATQADAAEEAVLARNVARMNAAIEDAIRRAPDHWMWGHRRWRTQPEGAPRSYPSRHGRDERRADA